MTVTAPRTGLASPATDKDPDPRKKRSALARFWPQYVAISPFYLLFAVFGLFPILFSLFISFHDWDGVGPMTWVGLQQYAYLVSDPRFWNAVGNTFIIWFLSTVPMLLLALLLAFTLHQNIRFKGFYRVAFFLPNVTSMVAMAIVFGSVFSDSFGLVNSALTALHLDSVPWLTSNWGIKVTIAVMVIWRWTGYNAIIFLAGLQAISEDVYDAAKVDGAPAWRIFAQITVPLLRPVILFTVITSTIGGLGLFTEPQVLLGDAGGPNESGMTMVLYQYNQAFTNFDFGYGSAIGWALFIISSVFALINWRLISERNENGRFSMRRTRVHH
jgi:cellobiose transport system permease protein